MGYTALYRKFRPMTFSEVVGQEHITRTLRNQVMADRVGHAYLFNGGRGTGKTSSAKILARAINCLNPKDGEPCNECEICKAAIAGTLTDIVEMDAASNNGVDDIRSIREEVNFLPTKAKYRVYIIDEVHMLSSGAFNALLKTLEEPPKHVKFILATTEPQKLPATILSRCQRFDFKRISNENIVKRLKEVCQKSDIEITESALNTIAVLADGAMRDALSILDRCIQDGENKISEDKIKDLVGIPKITYVYNIIDAIIEYNVDKALQSIDDISNQGKDLNNFLWEMIKYVKDLLIFKTSGKLDLYSEDEINAIKKLTEKTDKQRLVNLIYELSNLQTDMKWSTQKTIMFEAGVIKLCSNEVGTGENVEERLDKIEKYLKSGKANVQNTYSQPSTYTMPAQNVKVVQNFNIEKSNSNVAKPIQNKKINITNNALSSDLNKSWPKILNQLQSSGKIVLYMNLKNTRAAKVDDNTVEIKFPNQLSPFGKTVLEKQENREEIVNLISSACGKNMQIKFVSGTTQNVEDVNSAEADIKKIADDANIPFNVVE